MRELFLLDPAVVFLNHGSFGACPAEVFDAYQRWQREMELQPVRFLGRRSGELLESARSCLAAYVHARPEDLVFVTNTTTAINAVAASLPLAAGDAVLSTDHEYGACDAAWEKVCGRAGVRYEKATIPLPMTSDAAVADAMWSRVTPRTRVVYLSHITSTTAVVFPVAEICRRARAAGIFTVVDGAHAPGHLPLDLTAIGADVYVGNCHKWLCAPKGSAFLHARAEHHAMLDAPIVSWGYCPRVEGHTDFEAYTGRTTLVRKFQWQGTRDLAAFLAVPAAIEFQAHHGWDEVRRRCHEMAADVAGRVASMTGLEPNCDPLHHGQMVTIPLPPCDAHAVKNQLCERFSIEVPITLHGGATFVRVSVQGYNTAQDLERLVEAIAEIFSL